MTKTVLISGGSRGIGRATAQLMASQGWQVAFTYRNDAKAAAEVCTAIGTNALSIQSDTTVEADVIGAFDQALAHFGSLDAVVINAGIVGQKSSVKDLTVDRMKQMFDTNILGAFLYAREAARRIDSGSVTFVSSLAAKLGSPHEYVDYAASKGAIDTLTLGLAKELAPKVRVNTVRPGLILTDIHASGGQPDRAERLGVNMPLERAGTADEVAQAIAWFASDAASYCTGSFLDVSGGR